MDKKHEQIREQTKKSDIIKLAISVSDVGKNEPADYQTSKD